MNDKDKFGRDQVFLQCSCGVEMIHIVREEEGDYFVSIYRQQRNRGLLNRLRHIWSIIRTGEPYGDDVVLTRGDAEKMGKFLLEIPPQEKSLT